MEKEYIDGERRRTIKMSGAAAAALFGLGSVDTVSGQSTTKQKHAAEEFEEAFEDEVTVEEVITTEEVPQRDVGPESAQTARIRRSVTGEGALGVQKIYQFSHTLEWSYFGRRVQSYNSSVDGRSLSVYITYEGPSPHKEVDFAPQRSAVRVLREGHFQSSSGFNSFYPSIKLGGDGRGRGFVIELNENDPQQFD